MKHRSENDPATGPIIAARKLLLTGHVQGVGFRPFVYRLALEYELNGWVKNCVGVVEIHVQGQAQAIDDFISDIFAKKPALAKPVIKSDEQVAVSEFNAFTILPSQSQGEAQISVPADLYLCDACLVELNDATDRRYRYPFINCTQCGPRYTLIKKLPYDRANTTMADFELCASCLAEYNDPRDRRFHAEPVACADCGPSLIFRESNSTGNEAVNDNESALQHTVELLRRGRVVAVKGIGGYHLMCDARNAEAVARLRNNKPRPHKPLAVMFPAPLADPFRIAEISVTLDDNEKAFLLQPSRPVLLVKKNAELASAVQIALDAIAPGLNEIGIMLPYSPLHHLLLNEFAAPLVATSANISGEPVLIDNEQVERRLTHVADAFLHHDRPIERPADDPVYRTIASKARPIRTGRGAAPIELELPFELEQPVLAVGAHMKNTITLAWKDRAVVSPHIGEMDTARSLSVFENTVDDLQRLYGIEAEFILCDAHPGYTTTRWAGKKNMPVYPVLHHHAHASAAFYECHSKLDDEPVLVFSWDGTGFGEDGQLWGGETFLGRPGAWQRVASMRPFKLPGGDKAGREPWRSAAALCWQLGQSYSEAPGKSAEEMRLLKLAWQKDINAPSSTSVGRLFDAAAALSGICEQASFEGQAPMQFEAVAENAADDTRSHIEIKLSNNNKLLIYEWKSLIYSMTDSTLSSVERSSLFHSTLARVILQQAKIFRQQHGIATVCFSGGVFQNRVLTERAVALLIADGFEVCLPELIPVNDAGISFGQVIEYGYTR